MFCYSADKSVEVLISVDNVSQSENSASYFFKPNVIKNILNLSVGLFTYDVSVSSGP